MDTKGRNIDHRPPMACDWPAGPLFYHQAVSWRASNGWSPAWQSFAYRVSC